VTAVKNCVSSLMLVNCVQMWSAGKRRLILKIWNVLTLRYRVWKGNYSRRMEKPPDSQTQYTLCGSIYPFYYSWILCFHINSIHVPNGPVGTDEFWSLSVGRLWRHKFLQQQVELQIQKQRHFSNKPRICAAKFFTSVSTMNGCRWLLRIWVAESHF
jgi:hypothetical protein